MDGPAAPWRVLDDPTGVGAPTMALGSADVPPSAAALPWRTLAGLAVAGALAAGAFAMAAAGPGGTVVIDGGQALASGSPETSGDASGGVAGVVVVDVQGAILRPGVHRLAVGSRVGDAITAAGGYGPRVDAERAARELNLAAVLVDGDRILVPSRDDVMVGEPGAASGPPGGEQPSDGLIDLNNASASELDELPGVGPVTAQKIIDARTEQPFASVDDLLARKVVGQSTFDKLRDLVTVR
ncbi:MAG TPA: ComEA family DNA-binding protein [Candidatus Limnocylindrales bacterium]